MPFADRLKASNTPKYSIKGRASIPAISVLNVGNDVTIPLDRTAPDTNYETSYDLFGVNLAAIKVVEKSKTTSAVVYTVTALATIAIGGTIRITATSLSV
jgi:hypothetical protein